VPGVWLLLTPRKGGLVLILKAAALLLKGPTTTGLGKAVRGLRPLYSRGLV
jgi:hypothetical protein